VQTNDFNRTNILSHIHQILHTYSFQFSHPYLFKSSHSFAIYLSV